MKKEDLLKAFAEMSPEEQQAARTEILAKSAYKPEGQACCSDAMKEHLHEMMEKMHASENPMAMCEEMMQMCHEKMAGNLAKGASEKTGQASCGSDAMKEKCCQ